MTIDDVEKTVRQVLNEFRQTMLNERTASEITNYIVERLRIERHLKDLQKQRQDALSGQEHVKVPTGVQSGS